MRTRAWRLAARGVAHLHRSVVVTTCGARFPQNASAVEEGAPERPAGLYDGAAGVGLVLLRWAQLDSSPRHRALAQAVVDGLLESTRASPNNPSLYGGDAGVAVLLVRAAQVWKDAVLRDHAHDIALALSDTAWTMPDLLFGPAGTGLALLAVQRATRDPALLRGVRRCVARLAETAVRQSVGVAWRLYADRDEKPDDGAMFTGFAHGAAGIIGFLSEAARAMPADRRARALLRDAGAWLDAQCRALPRGRAAWPRSSTDPTLRHHWCHGTQGIALGYLWRYAHTRSPAHLVRAVSAGLHAWDAVATDDGSRPSELACHCHGLAGALDTFRALATATGDQRWHQRGRAIVGRLERLAGPGHDPSALGGDGCGFSTGTAGVVAALMADAGCPVVPSWSLSGLRDLRELTRPRPARRSRGVVRRLSALVMANPLAFVPSLAAPLEARATIAFLPRARRTIGAREAARILRRAESAPVHVAGHEIEAGTARLFRDYRDQLSSRDAFDTSALLRRLVGLSWSRADG
ncbi:MAG: lanthionine synthetase LanC family protein, partial [Gemmatimonadales bacterium]